MPSVNVTVFDVADRTVPAIVQETQFDGRYVDSRSVNGFVYLVLQQSFMLPPPQTVCSDDGGDDGGGEGDGGVDDGPILTDADCVYQTEEEYVEWVRANSGELITQVLPEYTSYDADHQFVRGGLLVDAADIFRPDHSDIGSLLVVTGVDMTSSEPGPISSTAIPTSPTAHIYASRENLYVFDQGAAPMFFGGFSATSETATNILKFAWNAENGQIDFVATGEVPGSLHNQFSVDQYGEQLRIATTSSNFEPGESWARSSNELFVLTDNGGVIEGLGSLQGLAPQETIRSVRFLGNRAYVVTFRNIDPLFALDLSDPTNPHETGQLKIPGFSSYLQFVGDHYLLGLGRNTPDGWNGPPQLTLFDVSDTGLPVVVDQYTWDHWSQTEAAADHHAFGYFAEHDALAIPVGNWHGEWVDDDGDGFRDRWVSNRQDDLYVFQLGVAPSGLVDPKIQLLGKVTHDWQVRRSGYIADRLYSVSTDDLIVADVTDPSVPIATLVFGATIDGGDAPSPPLPVQTPTPLDDDPLRASVRTASANMADQLGIELGRIALVIAEADRYPNACDTVTADGNCVSASDPGYALVLQADGTRYLYQTHQPGDVQLVDAEFDFTATVTPRHNSHNPLDTDDDGEVSPLDALLVINVLNEMAAKTSRTAPLRAVDPLIHQSRSAYYTDVNGDGSVAPIDALWVINYLNATAPLVAAGATAHPEVALPAIGTAPAAESVVDRSATMATRSTSGDQLARSWPSVAPQRNATLLTDSGLHERPRRQIERSSHSQPVLRSELDQQANSDLRDTVRGELHDRFFSDLGKRRV